MKIIILALLLISNICFANNEDKVDDRSILVFNINGQKTTEEVFAISQNIGYTIIFTEEHTYVNKIPDGIYKQELLKLKPNDSIYIGSGKCAEFEVKDALITSFKSESIKLNGERDKAFEEVFCYVKNNQRVVYDSGKPELGDGCPPSGKCEKCEIPPKSNL